MLKSLVQLFAEKFLVSKKEWIGHQSAPAPGGTANTVVTVTPSGDWKDLVAPFDGYFWVSGLSTKILLDYGGLWQGLADNVHNYKGFTLPVSKGTTIRYNINTDGEGLYAGFKKSNAS